MPSPAPGAPSPSDGTTPSPSPAAPTPSGLDTTRQPTQEEIDALEAYLAGLTPAAATPTPASDVTTPAPAASVTTPSSSTLDDIDSLTNYLAGITPAAATPSPAASTPAPMTDFTVPASDLTVPSSNLSVDDTLTNYLSSLSPSDQAAVNAAALFAQQNANTGNGSNLDTLLNNAATTTQTGRVIASPMTQTVAGGVDIAAYFSNPEYRAQVDSWMGNNVGAPAVQAAQEALGAAAVNNSLTGINVGGGSTTPFTAQVPSSDTTSTTAPTPAGLESLVPPGGDQTQTQIQTQPPQGEQVPFGGGQTAGRSCPAPWIKITMAGGGVVNAGDIKPGMLVYTRHETTGEWGNFPVTAVEQGEDTRWAVLFEGGAEFVGTFNHRVMTDKDWTEIRYLQPGDKVVQHEGFAVVKSAAHLDHGPVVKIEIQDAHTYLSEGVLSHNIKMNDAGDALQMQLAGDTFQEIDEAAGGGLMGLARGGAAQSFFRKGKFNFHPAQMYADGGMPVAMAVGGLGTLGGYSDGGRLLKGPGDGVSDSIPATIGQNAQPARLADGEFVIPARIVSELGNGSTDAGARKLYAMMDRIQRTRGKTVGKDRVAVNSRADKNLPA